MAVLGDGVAQLIGDHALFAVVRVVLQKIVERGERAGAVEIVRIYDGERPFDSTRAAEHGVRGAPRLDAPFGDAVSLGQAVELLVDILHVENLLHALADAGLEIVLDLMLDDEAHLAETGTVCVEHRVVDDGVTHLVHGGYLLESAEAAAHSGGEDHKCRFH